MRDRILYRVLVAASVAGLVAHCLILARYTVDDAFISFRYARNLVDGHGLVFNPGERVEGYTNFLWTLIHAIGLRWGGDPELLAKVLGIAASVGTLGLIASLGRCWGHGRVPLAAFGCIFWASAGAVAITAVNGLETQLFTFLVTLGLTLYATPHPSQRYLAGSIVTLGISTLVRPEGWLVLVLTLGHHVLVTRRVPWPLLALAALIAGPHMLWRYSYYGSLVPNTLAAKTGGGFPQLVNGVEYVKNYINEYGKPTLYLLAALPFLRWPLDRPRGHALMVLAAVVAAVVLAGGDWIPHYRFLIPILPIVAVALQDGLISVRSLLPKGPGRRWVLPSVAIWTFIAVIIFDIVNQTAYLKLHTDMWADGYHHAHRRVGAWLRDHASPDETVALMDIGIVGFVSGMRVVDITGLTDSRVAASPGGWLKKQYPLDYLFGLAPEYFVLVSGSDYPKEPFGSSFPIDRAVFQDPRLLDQYGYLFSVDAYVTRRPHTSGYYLVLFRKKT